MNALGIQRLLGLGSYQTAWSILHRLRYAMVNPERDKLSGMVEVDETYVGDLYINMPRLIKQIGQKSLS